MENSTKRRSCLPVISVKGSHYEIGHDVGRTFSSLIHNYINNSKRLHELESSYNTNSGTQLYNQTLQLVRHRFPFYVKEIEGISDGAGVAFHHLFLLHMDDIIEVQTNDIGCTTIAINEPNTTIIGHTEDALSETLNNIYILKAQVVPTDEDILKGAKREEFSSLCYAGQLPGYTMGFNSHGLVYTINTLSPKRLNLGKTPRSFITRALLTAQDIKQAEEIVRDKGVGSANGFSVNLSFMNTERILYNFEVVPNDDKAPESLVNVNPYPDNKEFLLHCNKYQRIYVPEHTGIIKDSSDARVRVLKSYPQPRCLNDILIMLSDTSDPRYKVFRDSDDEPVKTVATGVFDLENKTWSLYTERACDSEPLFVIGLNSGVSC